MQAQRRLFLLHAARLSAVLAVPLAGRAAPAASGKDYPFSLGVASGAPLPDAVILWTRILPNPLDANSVPPVALSVR